MTVHRCSHVAACEQCGDLFLRWNQLPTFRFLQSISNEVSKLFHLSARKAVPHPAREGQVRRAAPPAMTASHRSPAEWD